MGKLSPTLYRVFLYLFHLLCLTNHVNFWDIFILALPILASKDLPGCQLFWKLGWLFWIIPKAFTYTFRISSWWNLRLNSFVLRFTFASSCCNSVTGLFSLFLCSVAVKLFFFFFFFYWLCLYIKAAELSHQSMLFLLTFWLWKLQIELLIFLYNLSSLSRHQL